MSALRERITLVLAGASLAVSGFLFLSRPDPASDSAGENSEAAPRDSGASRQLTAELRENLRQVSAELETLKRTIGGVAATPEGNQQVEGSPDRETAGEMPAPRFTSIDQRIEALESNLARLQSNYEGISLEGASAERAEFFASDEGAMKADEYFEAGKYSIAAEGYLTYYRNHPDDPDARAVLGRARSAYQRAGYSDMAIWVQEEMMRIFPENRAADLDTLAAMNKRAGNYDAAIARAAEAAELHANPQQRLWTRLYWAWYNQLRDGSQAGLDAYLEVQREIEAAGYGGEHKLGESARRKIDELRRDIASGN